MQYIPTTEPFFFPGGKTGCLLVHGFTGTPKEMRPLGEYLAAQGHTVLGVRLFGHSTQAEDMMRARWWDWLMSVEDGWQVLSGQTDRIFVIGLSMGGALSLLLSTRHSPAGVVTMDTPICLPVNHPILHSLQGLPVGTRAGLLRAVSKVLPYQHKPPRPHPLSGLMLDHISYAHNPTRAISELTILLDEVRRALPSIQAPALLIHSRGDNNVPCENMLKIHAAIGSQDKQMVWLEKSGHVVTRDDEHDLVFQSVGAFIQRVNAQSGTTS